jgi:hypothetical protein
MILSSSISKWIVMRWPMLIKMNSIWICLFISLFLLNKYYTSGKYHLAPFLVPTAIRSLVDTCWTANGLIEAIDLLIESIHFIEIYIIDYYTSIWSKSTLFIIQIRIKCFMNLDWWINLNGGLGWSTFLAWHLLCFRLYYYLSFYIFKGNYSI